MSQAFVAPILSEFKTLLQNNLNTKITAIDSNVKLVDSTAYSKCNKIFPERFPWVSIFMLGDATLIERETGSNIRLAFPIYVVVDVIARNEEILHSWVDTYNSAVVQAVISGGGYDLSNVADVIRPVTWGLVPVDEAEGTIVGGCVTRWEVEKTIDPTA